MLTNTNSSFSTDTPDYQDNPLPVNWGIGGTCEGQRFFLNHQTRTTTWLDPRTSLACSVPRASPSSQCCSLFYSCPPSSPSQIIQLPRNPRAPHAFTLDSPPRSSQSWQTSSCTAVLLTLVSLTCLLVTLVYFCTSAPLAWPGQWLYCHRQTVINTLYGK